MDRRLLRTVVKAARVRQSRHCCSIYLGTQYAIEDYELASSNDGVSAMACAHHRVAAFDRRLWVKRQFYSSGRYDSRSCITSASDVPIEAKTSSPMSRDT